MMDMTIERAEVLQAIRQSLRTREPEDAAIKIPCFLNGDLQEFDHLPRTYARIGNLSAGERITLFEERVQEYDATVQRVQASGIHKAVAERLHARSKERVAIPSGLTSSWLPNGFHFCLANDLSLHDLDRMEGVITGCTLAIALTGSIVLQHGAEQGPRSITLIPDYHLCIVFATQIVETVPEAFDRLAVTATLPTTFISGPSATSDIEMTRIKGVHGPRMLDILLVE